MLYIIVRINIAKTIANFIEYAGEKSDLGTLISMLNNYWSVLNNLNQKSQPEAFRSFILETLNVIDVVSDSLDKRSILYKRIVGSINIFETADRLIYTTLPQITGANDPQSDFYNQGYIKVPLLADAVSDTSGIVSSLVDFFKVVPSPMGIAMNILSSIFAQFSNALNLYKEANEKVAISIDELGRFIADVIGFAMENWEEMLLPITDFLAEVVPDGLNPYSGEKITLWGSAGNDVINGSDAKDFFTLFAAFSIFGSNGNDQITGDTLDDYLDGGAGNDKLYGGKGNDTLVGGEGNDLLDGGEGSDHMEGGAGFDTYYIDGNDTVYDSDGIGKIIFSGGLLHSEATAANFVRDSDGTQDIWYSVGENGMRDGRMTAKKSGQDLIITRAGDSVLLRGFFDTAKTASDGLSALGITLAEAQTPQTADTGAWENAPPFRQSLQHLLPQCP